MILVTGAAGSIGSELCRQIEFLKAKKIIALDHSEISLFNLKKIGLRNTDFVLGDIRNVSLINNLIKKNKIKHIFHAAAYKHVNMIAASLITNSHFKDKLLSKHWRSFCSQLEIKVKSFSVYRCWWFCCRDSR